VFLGRSVTQHKLVSDVTAHTIDEEVRRIIEKNYARAKEILETNIEKLHLMAEGLIKYETLDEQQIADVMQGQAPRPPEDWEEGGPPRASPSGPSTEPSGKIAPAGGGAH